MHNRSVLGFAGVFVVVLVAANCTYELPAVEVAVGGQGGSGGETGSSSSGGVAGPEVCLDDLDNDQDGTVDCADMDCADGFTCSDVVPAGWTIVAVERGDGAPPAAAPCASGEMPATFFTNPAGPAECQACMCGKLEGTTCHPPTLRCYLNSIDCGGQASDWTNEFANGDCAKPSLGNALLISCQMSGKASVDQPGACAPSAADFLNKDTWAGWVRACPINSTGNGGCVNGVCIPKPVPPQSTCIQKAGQDDCPAGWNLIEAYTSANDDRACSECTCEAAPTCSGGNYLFYDWNNCDSGGWGNVDLADGSCKDASTAADSGSHSIQRVPPEAAGDCMPHGGEPMGSVVPQEPVTFCCK